MIFYLALLTELLTSEKNNSGEYRPRLLILIIDHGRRAWCVSNQVPLNKEFIHSERTHLANC